MATKRKKSTAPNERKHEQFQRLRGKLSARERRISELEAELANERAPTDLLAALKQVLQLVSVAARLNVDVALRPGLESIAWIANDLRRASRNTKSAAAIRADTLERHRRAFAAINPAGDLVAVDFALTEAATIEPMRGRGGAEASAIGAASREAVAWVRGSVGLRLPPTITDEAILSAISQYRPGAAERSRGEKPKGRRARGQPRASAEERADALKRLLKLAQPIETIVRELARDSKQARERAERINSE